MADWDEIKRLAADFQRTQASDTLQRISERNCIDIVKKLTELNLLELIYTCDGKEFITPSHLLKEIEDEIYVSGGRMHLHDLASNLNVDYQHVESKAKELARDKPDEYSIILGQVIHSSYKNTLGKQIYDCMLVNGQLSIADFAKTLDLPSEFLLTIVKEILPRVMNDYVVSQDERTYYTSDMMDRYKSIIAGTLSAISKPTTIASLMKRLDIPERIFIPIVDNLIKEGRIDASVENRLFIPSIYAREQSEYINKFYSSNSYIEYDLLTRMDIKQPKAFLKKRYPEGIQLKTCFINPSLVSQVESLIEDSIASSGWIDISTILPTAIEADDIEQLLQDIFKKNKQFSSTCLTFNQTNVCSLGYLATCKNSFNSMMQTKAQEHLKQGKLMSYFLGGKPKDSSRANRPPIEKSDESIKTGENSASIQPEDPSLKEEATESTQTLDPEDPQPTGERGVKKDKKDKRASKQVEIVDSDAESDADDRGKKSKSRKSGGGTQGREIKQKATKKKYLAGIKGKGQCNDASDEEAVSSKTPRSTKGRAARRNMSPERQSASVPAKAKGQAKSSATLAQKEPLIFMNTSELIGAIKSRSSGECTEEFFEFIANKIQDELNSNYEALAKQVLDDYLKTQANEENVEPGNEDDVEIIE